MNSTEGKNMNNTAFKRGYYVTYYESCTGQIVPDLNLKILLKVNLTVLKPKYSNLYLNSKNKIIIFILNIFTEK